MKHNVKELDDGQLEMMWNFLRMGYQKANIPALKEHCEQLRQAMVQKTGGRRENEPEGYVYIEDVGTIVNCVVIETMCLYLSGALDKIETGEKEERTGIENAY